MIGVSILTTACKPSIIFFPVNATDFIVVAQQSQHTFKCIKIVYMNLTVSITCRNHMTTIAKLEFFASFYWKNSTRTIFFDLWWENIHEYNLINKGDNNMKARRMDSNSCCFFSCSTFFLIFHCLSMIIPYSYPTWACCDNKLFAKTDVHACYRLWMERWMNKF